MKQVHINLLDSQTSLAVIPEETHAPVTKPRRSLVAKLCIIVFGIGILATGASVFSSQIADRSNPDTHNTLSKLSLFSALLNFSQHADKPLEGEKDGRINILLLGMGGAGHEGSYLTDTIIIASIDPNTHKVALISLPRDLLVNIPGYGWRKINSAHAMGEAERPGHGPELAEQVISSTFHIPINYYIRIDFSGFEKIVDLVGGVNVFVDNTFTDYTYPTDDKKYQVVHFEQGPQIMDGVRALQYVRSRHSLNANEGSDFARSHRQQKVIVALTQKIMAKDFLLNPQKVNDVLATLNENLTTDMQTWELLKIAQFAKDMHESDVSTLVFDDSPNGYLHSEILPTDGAYVLKPNDGTFDAMSKAIQDALAPANSSSQQAPDNNTTVIIKNGTHVTGLASKVASQLKNDGYTISYVGNATNRDMTKNVIYDYTNGKKNDVLSKLTDELHADVMQGASPEEDANNAHVDFLVLLGQDSDQQTTSN